MICRTLMIINDVDGNTIRCKLPAWRPTEIIELPRSSFPEDFRYRLEERAVLYCHADLDVTKAHDLGIHWLPKRGPTSVDRA